MKKTYIQFIKRIDIYFKDFYFWILLFLKLKFLNIVKLVWESYIKMSIFFWKITSFVKWSIKWVVSDWFLLKWARKWITRPKNPIKASTLDLFHFYTIAIVICKVLLVEGLFQKQKIKIFFLIWKCIKHFIFFTFPD